MKHELTCFIASLVIKFNNGVCIAIHYIQYKLCPVYFFSDILKKVSKNKSDIQIVRVHMYDIMIMTLIFAHHSVVLFMLYLNNYEIVYNNTTQW